MTKRYTDTDKAVRPRCDQCEECSINGVRCHEIGCPNMRKTWDPERERWVQYVDCHNCGFPVEVGEACDCQNPEPGEVDA